LSLQNTPDRAIARSHSCFSTWCFSMQCVETPQQAGAHAKHALATA